jgi:hypothetical protein
MGSGWIVDRTNRLVVTNYHVTGEASAVYDFFPVYKDGKLIAEQEPFFQRVRKKAAPVGKVVFRDRKVDLALVQLDQLADGLRALPLSTTRPAPGTKVYSVGHPGASGGLWVDTPGEVRQTLHQKWHAVGGPGDRNRFDCEAHVVLTNSSTNHGDSGGPLVNDRGELVAVVHGANPGSNLLSLFIDVKEVRGVLERYARESGVTLALEEKSTLPGEAETASLPDALPALGNRDAGVRAEDARTLGEMGPAASVKNRGLTPPARPRFGDGPLLELAPLHLAMAGKGA